MHLTPSHLINFHVIEETIIAILCLSIAIRTYWIIKSGPDKREKNSRFFLFGSGYLLLAVSSLIHASIHALHLNNNLLYQTLLGYCFSILLIILSIAAEHARTKKLFPFLYLPLLLLLIPGINKSFPLFIKFRPLIWISVSYLSGVAGMLYFAMYHRIGNRDLLLPSIGYLLVSISSACLFFPAAIGSTAWFLGHLIRPFGFILIAAGFRPSQLHTICCSILYRALTAFSLLAAIPLLSFGTLVFFENISPVKILSEKVLIFMLLLITLCSALIFGMGMVIRLIRPIRSLKTSVENLIEDGFNHNIAVQSEDEIGELSKAFNQMLSRLRNAIDEQERMCRLAATGELASTLAHEIKNPLNAIGGAAAYLKKNYKGDLLQEFLRIIGSEVSRINQLSSTLLSFSKPPDPDPQLNDCNELIKETALLLSKEVQDQGITLVTDPALDLPPCNCDYNQLKQVLINLLLNASDAVGSGGHITVSSRYCKDKIYIRVKDNGPGMSQELIKDIFNPFFTTKARGTGLGLAISKTIIREHNGDLIVNSKPDRGSTFTIILQEDYTKNDL